MDSADVFTPDEVAVLVRAATAAPSLHNSQPWRFRELSDRIELHFEPKRALPVADPNGREQVISCGAALFNLRLAMARLGYGPTVELPGAAQHLATVARGPERPATRLEKRLYEAVYRRRSHRRPFSPEPVPQHPRRADRGRRVGRRLGEGGGGSARTDCARRSRLRGRALAAQRSRLPGELARWTRRDASRPDGVRLEALGAERYPVSGLPWALMADPEVAAGELERHPMLVLGTDGDTRAEWLCAGQALQRLLLTATSRGLAASLFTQVLEVPASRAALSHALCLPGRPQVVLRLGYPVTGVPGSARRSLDSVLVPDADQG